MSSVDQGVDLLERCRSGDRDAFRALVAIWSDLASRVALTLARDRVRAAAAIRDAFVECWEQLPASHSERPFRPALFGPLARTAIARAGAPETEVGPTRRALETLEDDERVIAVLHCVADFAPAEIALATGENIGRAKARVRGVMKSMNAALTEQGAPAPDVDTVRAALISETRGAELPHSFFDEAIAPKLTERSEVEMRRVLSVDPRTAWSVIVEPGALETWTTLTDVRVRPSTAPLHAGSRISGRGRIGARASRDETVVTRVEDAHLIAWRTRSSPRATPGAIEFRWSLTLEPTTGGCELVHRLHAVAFPTGLPGRALTKTYAKASDGMQASMHAGIERLAAAIEARGRGGA